ncbi:hypothetical protein Btru_053086 [Bulinus truncatus]|nr:hypothetical protein Btru_053086 [Bulinus truncatus]
MSLAASFGASRCGVPKKVQLNPITYDMEGDDGKSSVSKSSSFSPKVTRPKLPHFAGSGSRSISPRSKTDPGRGEIKAIMEDIMNLKKTDWKTFSRSRTSPLPKGKSMSTNTSPSASPRIGSPVSDESRIGLSRDRSRSLKILTDRLKNKNSKQLVLDEPKTADETKDVVVVSRTIELQSPGNTGDQRSSAKVAGPLSHTSSGSPRRSPDRRSLERTYDQIPESPEDLDEPEGTKSPLAASSDESFRSVPECIHEKSPDSDYSGAREKTPDSDGGGSSRSQEDCTKIKDSHEKAVEDEGVSDGGEHSAPLVSTYIYHPIPRNSKFLQLAATKPPKRFPPERRTGITLISARPRVGAVSKVGSDSKPAETNFTEDQPRQRSQRRSDSGKSSAQKSSPRFITHPPHQKKSHKELGSVDTNGFAALKNSGDNEEDQKSQSQSSLADSQFASEASDDNFQDVMESVVTEGADVADRKNGKCSKQKSKSDPSGDRACDILDFPMGMETPQFHSAPLLSKEEMEALGFDKTLMISEEDSKQKSRSENVLTSLCHEVVDDHSSGGEDDEGGSSGDFRASDTTTDSETALNTTSKFPSSLPVSAPVTPHGPSPSPSCTIERPSNLLSVPSAAGTGRKTNIFRSASSASVLQSRKPMGSPIRDKDVIRKYSITSDEAMMNSKSSANLVPDFLPIGDTVNAASMPAVWNKDRLSSTDSPEREPGFIKVGTLFFFLHLQNIGVAHYKK